MRFRPVMVALALVLAASLPEFQAFAQDATPQSSTKLKAKKTSNKKKSTKRTSKQKVKKSKKKVVTVLPHGLPQTLPQKLNSSPQAQNYAQLNDNNSNTNTWANPFTGATSTSTGSTGVSTLKIKDIKPKEEFSRFGFTWISYNAIDNATIQNATSKDNPTLDGEVRGWQMPTFSYNFNKDASFSVMPQFFNSWFGNPNRAQDGAVKAAEGDAGENQSYLLYMGNLAFTLGTKQLANLGNGFKLEGYVRYDAPTSERANLNGEYGENWYMFALDKSIGRFDLQLLLWERIYLQKYNTSSLLNADGSSAGKQVQNTASRDYEFLNIGFNATPKLCITFTGGAYNNNYYSDPNTNRDAYVSTHRVAVIDFSYTFSKRFTLSTGIWEDYAVNGKDLTWGNIPFDPIRNGNSSEVYLQGAFKIL